MPTFNCISLYWTPIEGTEAGSESEVNFRVAGDVAWREAMPLWFDARDLPEVPDRSREYRGSIVGLKPATAYEVRLRLAGTEVEEIVEVTTWDEEFPVARTVELPERLNGTYHITEGGSEQDGYVVYTSAPGKRAVIDGRREDQVNIRVDAPWVIIRNLDLKGARKHGIDLGSVHHIVIEGCDISDWGENLYDGWGRNFDSAVHHETPDGQPRVLRRVVIQRNRMHHPHSDSNSWLEARASRDGDKHPVGPQAIGMINAEGEFVVRYNKIYSDYDHMFNDAMGDWHNFSYAGFPGRDSDIYGNHISHCWDDGIEMEGANMNVRCWGNVIDWTFVGIGAAATSLGPFYIYRNVYLHSRRGPDLDVSSYRGQPFLKLGADSRRESFAHGRCYVFHNTVLQPPGWGGYEETSGAGRGIHLTSATKIQTNIVTRNNALWVRESPGTAVYDPQPELLNDFDYDISNGEVVTPGKAEINGIRATPRFAAPLDSEREWSRPLEAGTPGHDSAVFLPNFNDEFAGDAPDMGALENGMPVPIDFPARAP